MCHSRSALASPPSSSWGGRRRIAARRVPATALASKRRVALRAALPPLSNPPPSGGWGRVAPHGRTMCVVAGASQEREAVALPAALAPLSPPPTHGWGERRRAPAPAAAAGAPRASDAELLSAALAPLLSPPVAAGGGLRRAAAPCASPCASNASRASEAVASLAAGCHAVCRSRHTLAPPSRQSRGRVAPYDRTVRDSTVCAADGALRASEALRCVPLSLRSHPPAAAGGGRCSAAASMRRRRRVAGERGCHAAGSSRSAPVPPNHFVGEGRDPAQPLQVQLTAGRKRETVRSRTAIAPPPNRGWERTAPHGHTMCAARRVRAGWTRCGPFSLSLARAAIPIREEVSAVGLGGAHVRGVHAQVHVAALARIGLRIIGPLLETATVTFAARYRGGSRGEAFRSVAGAAATKGGLRVFPDPEPAALPAFEDVGSHPRAWPATPRSPPVSTWGSSTRTCSRSPRS